MFPHFKRALIAFVATHIGLQLPTSKGCTPGVLVHLLNSFIATTFCIDHERIHVRTPAAVAHRTEIHWIKLNGRLSTITHVLYVYYQSITSAVCTPPAVTHHTHIGCNHWSSTRWIMCVALKINTTGPGCDVICKMYYNISLPVPPPLCIYLCVPGPVVQTFQYYT